MKMIVYKKNYVLNFKDKNGELTDNLSYKQASDDKQKWSLIISENSNKKIFEIDSNKKKNEFENVDPLISSSCVKAININDSKIKKSKSLSQLKINRSLVYKLTTSKSAREVNSFPYEKTSELVSYRLKDSNYDEKNSQIKEASPANYQKNKNQSNLVNTQDQNRRIVNQETKSKKDKNQEVISKILLEENNKSKNFTNTESNLDQGLINDSKNKSNKLLIIISSATVALILLGIIIICLKKKKIQ